MCLDCCSVAQDLDNEQIMEEGLAFYFNFESESFLNGINQFPILFFSITLIVSTLM